ncbi:MAG: hypothetical protein HQK70_05360 [Desulfamplus sp.]|nr:hypothetical protein [Desulfamplus sp.]
MPPGGEGKISIKVNTRGYGGRKLMKTIAVMTNDSKNPEISLTVSGNVDKFVTITPSVVRLNGKVGEELKSMVKVIPEDKYPFTVTKIRAQEGKDIKYELKEEKSVSGGKEYSVSVENLKKDAGFYYDVLILETDSKIQPEIKINIMARLIDPNQEKTPLQGLNGNNGNTGVSVNGGANQIPFGKGAAGSETADGAKNNNFLEVIQKIKQQNAQKADTTQGENPNSAQVQSQNAPVQDPKRSEELKKKFEELIRQAQEKQKAQETTKKE